MIKTFNLSTEEERYYTDVEPEQAVILSYAQDAGLMSVLATEGFPKLYDKVKDRVSSGPRVVTCGDWSARKYQ